MLLDLSQSAALNASQVAAESVLRQRTSTGVPVTVAISYFPNWHATGAQGPWRAEPNLMVVDPSSHTVTLTYGSSRADDLGLVLTLVGILLLVELIRRRTLVAGWSALIAHTRRRRTGQR